MQMQLRAHEMRVKSDEEIRKMRERLMTLEEENTMLRSREAAEWGRSSRYAHQMSLLMRGLTETQVCEKGRPQIRDKPMVDEERVQAMRRVLKDEKSMET